MHVFHLTIKKRFLAMYVHFCYVVTFLMYVYTSFSYVCNAFSYVCDTFSYACVSFNCVIRRLVIHIMLSATCVILWVMLVLHLTI